MSVQDFKHAMKNQILTERLMLDLPRKSDRDSLLEFYIANRTHLKSWKPSRQDTYFTSEGVDDQLDHLIRQIEDGKALHWHLRLSSASEILAICSFTNIIRGPFQACNMGFALGISHQGKGFMTEALTASINEVFNFLALHRIMANYQPTNLKSETLLKKLGFEKEGYAKSYLKIDGHWRDHVLTALINSKSP